MNESADFELASLALYPFHTLTMAHEPHHRSAEIRIDGMTCGSCEILLERKLKAVPGVLAVDVNHRRGTALITADAGNLPSSEHIEEVIRAAGYACPLDISGNEGTGEEQQGILHVCIDGMTDKSCERLLREKLKLVAGVQNASVHHRRGTANIYYTRKPVWEDLTEAVESAGYQMRHPDEAPSSIEPPHRKWMEIGASLLIIFALYNILQVFNIISLAPSFAGASTFGGILLIGLVAGTSSCLAVTGGLLLSMAAKHNEVHQAETRWEKFRPLLSFNIGRIVSYFFFGGIVGLIGTSIALTPRMTGYMSILVALVMLYLALSILHIIPKGVFPIRLPKKLSHWIHDLSESDHPAAPFALGAFTFFLPCGFTQSLQFAALASGSFVTGAFTMGIFSLGTLPALLGISAISSTAKGTFSRMFLRFSGALVFVLAFWNLNSGLLLTGVDAASFLPSFNSTPVAYADNDPNVTQNADGSQVINMRVTRYGYEPSSFTVKAGKQTYVKATAEAGVGGCTSVLTVPTLGLTKFLQSGENQLGPFTPTQDFLLTCSMGMVRANVRVAGTANGAAAVIPSANAADIPANAQVVDLTWTSSGYAPNVIEVQQGRPTAVKVSASARTGGCMSTVVFPNFNQSAFVPAPGEPAKIVMLNTDQAQVGDYPITCGMGSRMATLRVSASQPPLF